MASERIGISPEQDTRFMRLALRLAKRTLGQTAPNPAVGALIVDEATGEVIARGWTQPGGRPHAEAYVLERAGARARGCTMYVTLEPCSHHGRTPPCAEAILAAGVKRVVCAIEDPNPEISGKGLALLRRAGLAVDVGICAQAARWRAAGHILRMTVGRPFVQLKMAVSGDGLIAPGDGAPSWVTGPEVRAFAHVLRARADAILIGRKTVTDDDPQLTCRLRGLEDRSPIRVVLDPSFRTPLTSKMVRSASEVPVIIFGAVGSEPPPFGAGVETRQVALRNNGRCLDLEAVLRNLSEHGITRVMVEGGPTIARAFLDADLIDEVVIAQGTKSLGSSGRLPLVDQGVDMFADNSRWQAVETRSVGADSITAYHRHGRFSADEGS